MACKEKNVIFALSITHELNNNLGRELRLNQSFLKEKRRKSEQTFMFLKVDGTK